MPKMKRLPSPSCFLKEGEGGFDAGPSGKNARCETWGRLQNRFPQGREKWTLQGGGWKKHCRPNFSIEEEKWPAKSKKAELKGTGNRRKNANAPVRAAGGGV